MGFGMIQIYTGNGKGKTTASLGLAMRACGQGYSVCMIQFLKQCPDSGEVKAASFLPGFTLIQTGRECLIDLDNPEEIDRHLAIGGWETAKRLVNSGKYDIVILDEINIALACGLLDSEEVIKFITEPEQDVEFILTGRYAPPELLAVAHLITDMQEIRHPCNSGVAARPGIEF